ncbi:MAG: bifunctional serine/threonine-protein kinase/formylglycine-generating enzyme family protein [Bryobacteraceae bacterium]
MNPDANRIGRYEIKDKLGEGGMGVVYRALDSELMREVAIKVIRREALGGEDDALERFDREAKAAGQLKHHSIVTIYDRGEWNGLPYLVMELVEGVTLDQLLRQGGLDHSGVLNVLSQVASGVDYAHQRGVIHRDLKPANILVQSDGTAKILDFGIAKMSSGGTSATQVGMLVGSPAYMPPERFLGDDSTRSTDIWALGVTAFEALTGQRPFQGGDWQAVAYKICNEPTPDPTRLNPSLPSTASQVLQRVLAKSPDQRFSDCSGFTAALLSAYRSGAPTPPPPAPHAPGPDAPTRVEPIGEPATPSRSLKAAGAGVAAGAVLALGVWLSGWLDPATPVNKDPDPLPPPVVSGPAALIETTTGAMMLVPGGEARLGPDKHLASLGAFYIDKTEVSVDAYRRFCEATGRALPAGIATDSKLPVTNVTWAEASAFAAWAGKRLPTGDEWEKAARGASGQVFPWGEVYDPGRANLGSSAGKSVEAVPVDSFASGASPYGPLHMVGNVWEWTATSGDAGENFPRYAQMFKDLAPPLTRGDGFRQVRGASYRFAPTPEEAARLTADFSLIPERARRQDIGFRCARNP